MSRINSSPFPILTTERLTLRQISIEDKGAIFALRSDAAVNKFLSRSASHSIDDAINFINQVNENIKNNNSLYWVICLTKTKAVVGTICLFDFSSEQNSCEIGYELMTSFQGKGLMTEAIEKVISYVFETLQFQKITAFTHKGNLNSTKLLTKFNFQQAEEASEENLDFNVFSLTHLH
ncbi:GNAT family N-acetyltransferase [Pedobacter aquatilis]|uniref:GNAT family N-acetyltransferase n=1 Tax=Pedobacter aquatilis TaxID=351343 RepID=UPI00292D9783|nr:GNAT family N-acetyltransferase [Pedobacter aquatilis]